MSTSTAVGRLEKSRGQTNTTSCETISGSNPASASSSRIAST